MAGMAASPAALARSLAYLQIDMTDPDFRRLLVKQARATRAGLRRLVEAALEAGELDRSARPAQLARTIETVLSGSMITWGFYREGNAARWMRADLDAVPGRGFENGADEQLAVDDSLRVAWGFP
jgi:hypothetical protein